MGQAGFDLTRHRDPESPAPYVAALRLRCGPRRSLIFGPRMTHRPTDHETPPSLLPPLGDGLLRRTPDILALSIHDDKGHAVWASGDFLLAEDHALIAEVVEEPVFQKVPDVRGPSCGLWWESADTARARC